MDRFKIGDIVRGNEKSRQYAVTNEKCIARVMGFRNTYEMKIKVIKGECNFDEEKCFWVNQKCFELVTPQKNKTFVFKKGVLQNEQI